jgi:pilus assembly protein FimV
VAEADFHMAYGLYDQAAELVSKALEAAPQRRDLKLKLLEVYFVWGNKDAFLSTAKELRTEIGDRADADWDKVAIMGKQLCPDEPVFTERTSGAAHVDVDLDAGGSTRRPPTGSISTSARPPTSRSRRRSLRPTAARRKRPNRASATCSTSASARRPASRPP